ncbi:MAG: hypothetical protein HY395_01840 [Candidatus Doudnabacteria bacterium]|nr:hypothetical protein [Candidatus Doudnabacteria bacterium]
MSNKSILKGMGVSVGKTTGRVCVVRSEKDFVKLNDDDILVTKITDPSMTLIINKSAGIVCDIGGMTSHPAIIARELGIPAVVGTNNATEILKDGMLVEVDGTKGEIFLKE